ncbi:hypothetical protein RBSWK_01313 [Rhodopirellula baltica SWK14]|uniref:Uncharacterized protein n=1 Tax=Rhodopirellula baltica SWK14 TaxID=993516 RepID=L7CP12_RHOBT|nr:hypothetical protein RBSWK_01313 [Rhodopirellula baltica SWK14]
MSQASCRGRTTDCQNAWVGARSDGLSKSVKVNRPCTDGLGSPSYG